MKYKGYLVEASRWVTVDQPLQQTSHRCKKKSSGEHIRVEVIYETNCLYL